MAVAALGDLEAVVDDADPEADLALWADVFVGVLAALCMLAGQHDIPFSTRLTGRHHRTLAPPI